MDIKSMLNKEQIDTLRSIGILDAVLEKLAENREKPAVKRKSTTKPAEEYMLEVIQVCKTCRTEYHRLYYMQVTPGNVSVLTSELIPLEELQNYQHLPYMEERRMVATCGGCREYLTQKDKSELISIILRGYRHAEMGR